MPELDLEVDVEKIDKEIKNLLRDHKFYWYDFNVTMKNAKIIKDYFSKFYNVELRPCPQSKFCDVIIDLTKLLK